MEIIPSDRLDLLIDTSMPRTGLITKWGEFASSEDERRYYVAKWPRLSSRMLFVCAITGLGEIAGIYGDGIRIASESGFWLMLVLRCLAAAVAVFNIILALKKRPVFIFPYTLAAYILAVGLPEAAEIMLVYEPGLEFHAPLTLLIVMMCYIVVPPRFLPTMIAAISISVVYLSVMAFGTEVPLNNMFTQVVFFVLVNGVGMYFLLTYGKSRRNEFRMLEEKQELNRRLMEESLERERINERLMQLTVTDELTGAANRRRFFKSLHEEFKRAKRYGHVISVLFMDLDYFKRINDSFGHLVGDKALAHAARVLSSDLRETDLFARIGGEEFAVLLPETELESAHTTARRMQELLKESPLEIEAGSVEMTVSIGVSCLKPGMVDYDDLVRAADSALYSAKAAGRNCVIAA